MSRHWILIGLLGVVVLLLGLFPADQGAISAVQRGDALASERRYSAALDAYAEVVTRCPGCPQPHLRQVDVYAAQGRHDEAWAALLDAMQRGGETPGTIETMVRLYTAQDSYGLAARTLERLLQRRPLRGDLWAQLGETHLAAEDPVRAREAFERALALDLAGDVRQTVHDRLGILCLDREPACALAHLEAAGEGPDLILAADAARLIVALRGIEGAQHDEPALARAKLGEALLHHGDLDRARSQFEIAVDLAPEYVDGHAYLGHVLSELGKDAPAVHHLERAIELEPDYPLPHYFLGMHHVRKGWLVTGRDVLLRAYDLDPSNPAICVAIADTHLRAEQADYAAAERWLHAAVDNDPGDVRFHLLLAHFYVDYNVDPGRYGVAVSRVAVQLAPESSEAHETLGWATYLGGQPEDALDPLLRARELSPATARIHYRLGEVYWALGRTHEAREAYQRAIDLDWHGPIGQRARDAMGR